MTSALGESGVIINGGTAPALCCQRPDPGNRCDKDTKCCTAALTLCHFSCAAGCLFHKYTFSMCLLCLPMKNIPF